MSTLLKSILQRTSGNIARLAKRSYHTPLTTAGLKYSIPATCLTPSEASLSRLVQKTIIPFTEQRLPMLDKPILNITEKIDITPTTEIIDIGTTKEIEDPTTSANLDKKAVCRMIKIRRKKMKKHQRKKRRKLLAFYYKKIQKKRSIKKNSKFNNMIIQQLREVKKFSAEAYVAEKLDLYRFKVLPNRVHGCRLPEFVVKEWLEKRQIRRYEYFKKEMRREKFTKERGGTLNVDPEW